MDIVLPTQEEMDALGIQPLNHPEPVKPMSELHQRIFNPEQPPPLNRRDRRRHGLIRRAPRNRPLKGIH